jgi:hypothetical protein
MEHDISPAGRFDRGTLPTAPSSSDYGDAPDTPAQALLQELRAQDWRRLDLDQLRQPWWALRRGGRGL